MIRATSFMGRMKSLNAIRKKWRKRWNGHNYTPCLTNRRRCGSRRVLGSEIHFIRKPRRIVKKELMPW